MEGPYLTVTNMETGDVRVFYPSVKVKRGPDRISHSLEFSPPVQIQRNSVVDLRDDAGQPIAPAHLIPMNFSLDTWDVDYIQRTHQT